MYSLWTSQSFPCLSLNAKWEGLPVMRGVLVSQTLSSLKDGANYLLLWAQETLLSLVESGAHSQRPITHLISCNHCETIQPYVIPSSTSSFVHSLPWLKLHKTHIDWSASLVTLVHGSLSDSPPPEPPDLSSVPPEYYDANVVTTSSLASWPCNWSASWCPLALQSLLQFVPLWERGHGKFLWLIFMTP